MGKRTVANPHGVKAIWFDIDCRLPYTAANSGQFAWARYSLTQPAGRRGERGRVDVGGGDQSLMLKRCTSSIDVAIYRLMRTRNIHTCTR